MPRPALPDPPRIDRLPSTLQHALRLRGAFVPCGPGLRGVGWPDTPRVRLAALAPWLADGSVATHLTAAWVWGAARDPGRPLTLSLRLGRRAPLSSPSDVRLYELRLQARDKQHLGAFEVTTPVRTLLDLLHSTSQFGTTELVACRLLMLLQPDCGAEVRARLSSHQRPHGRRAHARFAKMSASTN